MFLTNDVIFINIEKPDKTSKDKNTYFIPSLSLFCKKMETEFNFPTYAISFDIEADGRLPSTSSMIELGMVVGNIVTNEIIHRFKVAIKPRTDRAPDENTAKFWKDNQARYDEIMANAIEPKAAMERVYYEVLRPYLFDNNIGYSTIFIAHPAAYDWQWLSEYFWTYLGDKSAEFPSWGIGHKAICISSTLAFYMRQNPTT